MKARIVIGANYGDEGKGTVVASLTKGSSGVLNVLTNGGAQRGHSILTPDGSITFQHFGSGTYHGADNYYSRFYILNPIQFVKEYEALIVKPQHIYRDKDCRWSTPYDSIVNLIEEKRKGRKASCGMGIWNTVRRWRETNPMLFDDFVFCDNPYAHLDSVRKYYEKNVVIPSEWRDIWDSAGLMDHFIEDCKFMWDHTFACGLGSLAYEDYIFENGQGLLLRDTGLDTFDTTPSDTGITYALLMAREQGIKDITAHYVTRPYLTRHGDGRIAGEANRHNLSSSVQEDRTNHYNDNQGEFRYGALDIKALKQRIERDARGVNYEVDLTHCDEMDRSAEFKKEFGAVNTYDKPLI